MGRRIWNWFSQRKAKPSLSTEQAHIFLTLVPTPLAWHVQQPNPSAPEAGDSQCGTPVLSTHCSRNRTVQRWLHAPPLPTLTLLHPFSFPRSLQTAPPLPHQSPNPEAPTSRQFLRVSTLHHLDGQQQRSTSDDTTSCFPIRAVYSFDRQPCACRNPKEG